MKKDIKNLNLEKFANANNIDELWKQQELLPHFLPQAQAHIANLWKPQRNLEGQYCLLETLKDLDLWNRGLYRVLQECTRGLLVPTQTRDDGPQYCALVPIILGSYKKYHDIPYQQWSRSTLKFGVEKRLCEAMLCNPPQLSIERTLELRDLGLVYRSGANCGKLRNPTSTWRLYNLKNTEWEHLPVLAQTMLAQIWCAHPSIRNQYMVLDPTTWDLMPEVLLTTEIFSEPKPKKVAKAGNNVNGLGSETKYPWDVK